ncbi:rRNA-processing protein CGR1 [Hyphopichia burtonii NRRL Y-1933]|uniref:rRNA-processing protein n=1 Tax=Hyphopichia burtonii NRRL Y-1933 TaxID=984485 RepID=A0A1E4RHW4_9ASCO|nr:rRNA-processing protein CGR1 [Hyphopichia burtonii NRRL Y-1933]ODV66849.1 rRNA-processing protein CGR1 [Hyphopichia burtonii NRRL Y-1933]
MSASSSHMEYKDIPKKYIDPLQPKDKSEGARVNGKEWKIKKDAFRVKTLGVKRMTTFEKREQERLEKQQYRARLNDLKQEKEDAKNQRIADLKRRREIKEEKERYAKIALKMHAKKVERLRKREKRNKLLKER